MKECVDRGEAARKEAAAVAEVAAQQQEVMAAVEAEAKQEVVSEPSAFSQVNSIKLALSLKS